MELTVATLEKLVPTLFWILVFYATRRYSHGNPVPDRSDDVVLLPCQPHPRVRHARCRWKTHVVRRWFAVGAMERGARRSRVLRRPRGPGPKGAVSRCYQLVQHVRVWPARVVYAVQSGRGEHDELGVYMCMHFRGGGGPDEPAGGRGLEPKHAVHNAKR